MQSAGSSHPPLPAQAPVMLLPGAVLFPHALMPLYIFEPRYRAMLRHTLEHDRMFCIAMYKHPEHDPDEGEQAPDTSAFHHTAGIGLVRACVAHEDGTSHLVLQGVARVNLRSFIQEDPYLIAEIRELWPAVGDPDELHVLSTKLREKCAQMKIPDAKMREKLNEQLAQITDPSVLGDLLAHTFLQDPCQQQEVLEERNVGKRLRMILKRLGSK